MGTIVIHIDCVIICFLTVRGVRVSAGCVWINVLPKCVFTLSIVWERQTFHCSWLLGARSNRLGLFGV